MARQFDGAVVVVTALTTFFATLFAALVLLRGAAPPEPRGELDREVGARAVHAFDVQLAESTPLEQLRRLGVRCVDGCQQR